MDNNSFFDIKRLKLLLMRQLSFNSKALLIATGAVMGLIMFIGTMVLIFSFKTIEQAPFLNSIFPSFFIVGFIFTSIVFSELNSPHRGYMYLTLPASALEKLASAWLICSIGFVLYFLVVMYLLNFYFIGIAALFTTKSVSVFNLFDPGILKIFGVYLVTQSVFFLGSLYFRRLNFLKTVLALFVVSFAIALFSSILSKILFFSHSGNMPWWAMNISNHQAGMKHFAEDIIVPAAKILFWGCTAPFFLLVSYYRLKEREV